MSAASIWPAARQSVARAGVTARLGSGPARGRRACVWESGDLEARGRTRLVAVVIDGLLAQDDQVRALLLDESLEDLRHVQRQRLLVGHHVDRAVSTHGQRRAQLLLSSSRADADGDHLRGHLLLLEPHRLLNGCARTRDRVSRVSTACRAAAAGLIKRRGSPISSNGFMLILTLFVSTPILSGFTRILTA